jgi:hypothetical protein
MYLIKEGEFELSKKIKKDVRIDIDYSQFVKKNPSSELNKDPNHKSLMKQLETKMLADKETP